MTDVMKALQHKARDHSRVPMPVRALPTSNIDSELTTKCVHPLTRCIGEISPISGRQIPTLALPLALPGCG